MATMQDIEQVAAQLEAVRARMIELITSSPELFAKRRTLVIHGMKVGLRQSTRDLSWEDDAALVAAIRQHLPLQFSELVEVSESPIKDALAEIDPTTLSVLGVKVKPAGARVIVKLVEAADDRQLSLELRPGAAPC